MINKETLYDFLRVTATSDGRTIGIWLDKSHVFWYENSEHSYLPLRKLKLQQILPDYYEEFVNAFSNLYQEHYDYSNENITKNKSFVKNNGGKIINIFLELYEKQLFIFKLTNIKSYLEIEKR